MGAGEVKLQASDLRIATVTFEDGAAGNVSVVVPKEGGVLASEAYVASQIGAIPVIGDASETAKGIIEIATNAEVQTGTDTVRAVTPAGLLSAVIGIGQTWQDVNASRVAGTTYTNTDGKPREVWISLGAESYILATYYIDNVARSVINTGGAGYSQSAGIPFIVPNNSTYKIVVANGAINKWHELR